MGIFHLSFAARRLRYTADAHYCVIAFSRYDSMRREASLTWLVTALIGPKARRASSPIQGFPTPHSENIAQRRPP